MKNESVYNVFDYLEWRGDLTFSEAPFNEIDNLIFAVISYFDLDGYVDMGRGNEKTIKEIISEYKAPEEEKKKLITMSPYTVYSFVKAVSATRRFGNIPICFYENIIDEKKCMQFSAMTFLLPDKTMYVAFRGTDETLTGWKEDFMMSFGPVNAQLYATEYLNKVSSNFYYKKMHVGGHSKGGNLALWAGIHAKDKVQKRIIDLYSNDSPGFTKDIVNSEEYRKMTDKINLFVVSESLVGMLLFNEVDNCKIIDSFENGVFQHDPFSWKVLGSKFVCLDERPDLAKKADSAIGSWIDSLDDNERRAITDFIFSILESTGAKTVSELRNSKVQMLELVKKAIFSSDRKSKDMIMELIKIIIK